MEEMQIAATNRTAGHFQNDICIIDDLRFRCLNYIYNSRVRDALAKM